MSRIRPGDSVAIGLALEHAIPFAAGHELIRQEIDGLTLIGPISDMLFDQLIGSGLVEHVRAAWVGNVSTGSAYRFRDAAEHGHISLEDHSNFSVGLALRAGALGVPFLPTRSLLGSDILLRNSDFLERDTARGQGRVVLVPAIRPDWAVVHVQRAAACGDAQFWGNAGIVEPAVAAADRVLVTAEEIVETEVVKRDPDRVVVTRDAVAAVVEAPGGARPSPLAGRYDREHRRYLDYAYRTRTQRGYDAWAGDRVHGASGAAESESSASGTGDDSTDAGTSASSIGPYDWTERELMIAAGAREIEDGDVVFVGMRLPLLAYQVAVSTHAPEAIAVFENGIVRDEPASAFLHTMSDLPNQEGAISTTGLLDVMGRLGRAAIDVGFLGGAQIDRRGNLNTTSIETGQRTIRLPGSGGACDIACLSGRTAILMPHEPRRFVEKVDYVTSPGHTRATEKRGTPSGGGGPDALITSKATFGFSDTGELYLRTVHPGVDVVDVSDDFPWPLETAKTLGAGEVTTTAEPRDEMLDLIREFDPDGFWTR